MKIVRCKYYSPSEFFMDSLYQSFRNVGQFVSAFNASDFMPEVHISKSLVDSWICGRRKISSSSAALVWKVASVLAHHESEHAVYVILSGLLHGAKLPVYADD